MSFDRTFIKAEEVHVFDFDGTIFYSPSVDEATAAAVYLQQLQTLNPTITDEEAEKECKSFVGSLANPVSAGGLGWYQSLSSLTPPAVPAYPDEETWYVQPIIDRIRRLAPLSEQAVLEDKSYERKALMYVLTGRDVKYTPRIRELLRLAGLLDSITFVFLKPTETSGTVKFKQNKMLDIIRRHTPRRVWYYDDRLEQGARIFAGLHELQGLLYAPEATRRAWQPEGQGADTTTTTTTTTTVSDEAALTTHAFSTLCVLGTSVPLTGNTLSPADTSVVPASAHVPFNSLFRARSDPAKEAVKAIRAGRRWAAESIAFLNSRWGTGEASAAAPLIAVGTGKDALLVEHARFPAIPPFHLTQVFMPDAIAEHSDDMLDAAQVQQLIETLQDEKVLYDGMSPQEREARTSYSRGGRGRGGGRGGRGSIRGQRAGNATIGHGVWEKRASTDYSQAFPSLPGA